MVLLIVFGLIQDISFNAPFGCFVIVNLVVYGFSAWIASMFDVLNEPLVAVVAPVLQFVSGFLVLWLLASALEDHVVRASPLLAAFLTTGVIYAMCHKVFDLGRVPGQPVGQAT
jgi:hypothetical protein